VNAILKQIAGLGIVAIGCWARIKHLKGG